MTDSLNIQINGKDHVLNKDDCNKFTRPRGRNNNDHNNKVRELAIYCMANNIVPNEWLDDQRWLNLNNTLHDYLNNLVDDYQEYTCVMKAGRGSNYDFDLKYKIDEEITIIKIATPSIIPKKEKIEITFKNPSFFFGRKFLNEINLSA